MYMTQPDRQRIQHIRDYCEEIRKTIENAMEKALRSLTKTQITSALLHFPSCKSVS